ncbi:hypothetical protein BKA70DRAFT_1222018 [Coprinopsis sp. MPI-PUGE-AT-0042]|nr:hypothetical protein BKA70DRAFT_1222018 [Coprinopsis sp. MPI-PUGE-AT-0042]
MAGFIEPMDVDEPVVNGTSDETMNGHRPPNASIRLKPLTSFQERRLINYLDDRWLELMRNFKKRSQQSSKLPTLNDYLEEARHLLALILQIPPVDPSTALRTTYLLRLTGDVLGSIVGYSVTRRVSDPFAIPTSDNEKPTLSLQDVRARLVDLVDFLDDLDQAWVAVLQSQAWDPSSAEGVDISEAVESILHQPNGDSPMMDSSQVKSSPPTATDVARLRSLLTGGESAIEEWLIKERISAVVRGANPGLESDYDDLTANLAQLGLLEDFDNLFTRTMDHIGFEDVKPEDMRGREEVPMSEPFPSEAEALQ